MKTSKALTFVFLLVSLCSAQEGTLMNGALEYISFENQVLPEQNYLNYSFTFISNVNVTTNSSFTNVSLNFIQYTRSSVLFKIFNATIDHLALIDTSFYQVKMENFIAQKLLLTNFLSIETLYKNGVFSKTNILESALDTSKFVNIAFNESNFLLASFNRTVFHNVTFINCNFNQVSFKEAEFKNVSFEGSLLNFVTFEGATIENGYIISKNLDTVSVEGAKFKNFYINEEEFTGEEEEES